MIIVGKFQTNHVEEKTVLLNKKLITIFLIIIICFSIDQISKFFIINFLTQQNINEYYINSFLNFTLVWNKGIAFGIFQSDGTYYNFISLFIFLVIVFIFILLFKAKKKYEIFSYAMISGGALGNLFDRVYYGAVPDFIDIHFRNFHWFIFNISDIFITIGIIIILIFDIFKIDKQNND